MVADLPYAPLPEPNFGRRRGVSGDQLQCGYSLRCGLGVRRVHGDPVQWEIGTLVLSLNVTVRKPGDAVCSWTQPDVGPGNGAGAVGIGALGPGVASRYPALGDLPDRQSDRARKADYGHDSLSRLIAATEKIAGGAANAAWADAYDAAGNRTAIATTDP
jgi:hypothetical protein